jgi:hypothetical protein
MKSKSADAYPIMNAPGYERPQQRLPPKDEKCAIFHQGKWWIYRVDAVYTLYERVAVKARRAKGDRVITLHHDIVPRCDINDTRAYSICPDPSIINEARSAAHFHKVGLS